MYATPLYVEYEVSLSPLFSPPETLESDATGPFSKVIRRSSEEFSPPEPGSTAFAPTVTLCVAFTVPAVTFTVTSCSEAVVFLPVRVTLFPLVAEREA